MLLYIFNKDPNYAFSSEISLYYHNFFLATGEKAPYILIGWGGGGNNIYEYALKYPQRTYSLVYLDTYRWGIEWKNKQQLESLTDAEIADYKKIDLVGRLKLLEIIRAIACPWGLMSIFFPYQIEKYVPADRYDENRFNYLIDKMVL